MPIHTGAPDIRGVLYRPTTKPENDTQALNSLIHGLYLSIFSGGSSATGRYSERVSSILDPVIRMLVARGLEGLSKFGNVSVKRALTLLSENEYHRGFSELFARIDTCPLHKALSKSVILAFNASPVAVDGLVVFRVSPVGDLTPRGEDDEYSVSEEVMERYRGLPPFWRWAAGLATNLTTLDSGLDDFVTSVGGCALPIDPGSIETLAFASYVDLPLPNVINILLTTELYCGPAHKQNDVLREISVRRMVSMGCSTANIIGSDCLKTVLGILSPVSGTSKLDVSRRLLDLVGFGGRISTTDPRISEIVGRVFRGALEAFALEADDDKSKDDGEEEEESDDTEDTSDGDSSDGDDADKSDGATQKQGEDPATAPDAPSDGDTGGDVQETVDNGLLKDGNQANSGDNKDNPMSDGAKHDDSMDLIPLDKSDETQNAYFYRLAVSALNTTLGRDSDLPVSAEHRNTLDDWCKGWLWLANISRTQELMRELGLQKLLKTINLKGR